jgi:hypothetical protein
MTLVVKRIASAGLTNNAWNQADGEAEEEEEAAAVTAAEHWHSRWSDGMIEESTQFKLRGVSGPA